MKYLLPRLLRFEKESTISTIDCLRDTQCNEEERKGGKEQTLSRTLQSAESFDCPLATQGPLMIARHTINSQLANLSRPSPHKHMLDLRKQQAQRILNLISTTPRSSCTPQTTIVALPSNGQSFCQLHNKTSEPENWELTGSPAGRCE